MPNFPSNPSNGDTAVFNGITYTYNNNAWNGTVTTTGSSTAGVASIVAGNGINVSATTGTVTIKSLQGDAKLIDTLLPSNVDPEDDALNWYQYFEHIGNNGGTWILPNRKYTVTGSTPIIFKIKSTKLMGETSGIRPSIKINIPSSISAPTYNGDTAVIPCGFWFANKTRIRGLNIEWQNPDDHRDHALLLFQKAVVEVSVTNAGNIKVESQADMDSSVDDCALTCRANLNTPGAGIITYLGRNMRVTGCTFASGGGSGDMRCISLSYSKQSTHSHSSTSNTVFDDNDGQSAATGGFRKNIVRDNTFHMTKDSVCVELFVASGTPSNNNHIYGLQITNNQNDVGGNLLRCTANSRSIGTVISGNVVFRGNVPGILVLDDASVISMVVTGNFFGGTDTESSSVSNNHGNWIQVDSGSNFQRCTITGNTFRRPTDACIYFNTGVNRITITGNTFDKDDRNSVPAIRVNGGSGVIVANTSNCDTFFSNVGSGNWTQTANL